MPLIDLANPTRFLGFAERALPWLIGATVFAFAVGLGQALFIAPDDYQQGATVKIMFLHVPSAWLAMFCWGLMSLAALGTLVWRHPLADVAAKALAHWLTTGLPLVIAVPVLGLLLDLEPAALGAVALTLLVGTPALTFIGLIGAALSVALRRGGLLLPILVLPLTVPVLIFGVSAAETAIVGPVPFGTPFTILCALTLVSFVVGTFAAAAALRHGME